MGAAQFFGRDLLAGQVALVTGGGTGIGLATAVALGQCGAEIVLASRRQENLDRGAAVVEEATGRRPLTVVCDIRKADQVATLSDTIIRHAGRIDVLVNNAGGQFAQAAEQYSIKGWNAVVDTNLNGTWYVTQAIGKHMIAARRGAIVNVIANYHRGIPGVAHTSAARAAVANLTKTLAIEWGEFGIRLNAVAPGPIAASGFTESYDPQVVAKAVDLPLRRLGTVDEVAAAIVFLASPASAWTTGATLDVTGGQHLSGNMWVIDRS